MQEKLEQIKNSLLVALYENGYFLGQTAFFLTCVLCRWG